MARDEKIVIRLTDDVKEEFHRTAENMGMTISALGSYVIGDYLRRLKNERVVLEKMAGNLAAGMVEESVAKVFGKFDEEKLVSMFFEVTGDLLKNSMVRE